MNDEQPRKKDDEGGGGWITTFADLMSLLMCFFVLLLSFAELDVMKFKAIAGSMKLAFGVQREIKAIEVPKGTSIVAQEFSAGKPDPTVINEVRQNTMDEDKQSLEFTDALVNERDGTDPEQSETGSSEQQEREQAEIDAARLSMALKEEVAAGMIQIETTGATITIRIREKGSFPSGSARFDPAFRDVIARLRKSLQDIDGTIAVAGHTDNIPIKTARFRSNWELSSARAVSVVHALLDKNELDPVRFVIEGHGDAHPLVENDTRENRAKNRRVEITIRRGVSDAPLKTADAANAASVLSSETLMMPPPAAELITPPPAETPAGVAALEAGEIDAASEAATAAAPVAPPLLEMPAEATARTPRDPNEPSRIEAISESFSAAVAPQVAPSEATAAAETAPAVERESAPAPKPAPISVFQDRPGAAASP